jgi:hypothetical protein
MTEQERARLLAQLCFLGAAIVVVVLAWWWLP